MQIPSRQGMTALVIRGLPRLGPFRLEHGPTAFARAKAATARALGGPVAPVIWAG